jgi:hypothetical protein
MTTRQHLNTTGRRAANRTCRPMSRSPLINVMQCNACVIASGSASFPEDVFLCGCVEKNSEVTLFALQHGLMVFNTNVIQL